MPRKAPDSSDALLQAVAEFLESKGWKVVVIGGARVQKEPSDAEFNYEFVVRFTGGPPKEEKGREQKQPATT